MSVIDEFRKLLVDQGRLDHSWINTELKAIYVSISEGLWISRKSGCLYIPCYFYGHSVYIDKKKDYPFMR